MPFSNNKKRKYRQNVSGYRQGSGNLLGRPAILFTCETGRESRVRRESIQLLDHYYPKNADDEKSDLAKEKEPSLEEEIAQLQKNTKKKSCNNFNVNSHFEVNGTVLVQCDIPSSIPLKQEFKEKGDELNSISSAKDVGKDAEDGEESSSENKKLKQATPPEFYGTCWNPVEFVRKVLGNYSADSDTSNGEQSRDNTAPDSRFITRIIPLQATCRAKLEDITFTITPLLEHYIFSENRDSDDGLKKSFEIVFKKRNCGHLDRMECITAIAKLFDGSKYDVNLTNPDYSIIVEVCKNFCGISVIQGSVKSDAWSNFNVQQIKESQAAKTDGEDTITYGKTNTSTSGNSSGE